jgi:hypothetical protein
MKIRDRITDFLIGRALPPGIVGDTLRVRLSPKEKMKERAEAFRVKYGPDQDKIETPARRSPIKGMEIKYSGWAKYTNLGAHSPELIAAMMNQGPRGAVYVFWRRLQVELNLTTEPISDKAIDEMTATINKELGQHEELADFVAKFKTKNLDVSWFTKAISSRFGSLASIYRNKQFSASRQADDFGGSFLLRTVQSDKEDISARNTAEEAVDSQLSPRPTR